MKDGIGLISSSNMELISFEYVESISLSPSCMCALACWNED